MIKRLFIILIFTIACYTLAKSQDFTQRKYGIQMVERNLVYGTAINYLGEIDTLKLDIYKPAGFDGSKRPLLILNHGGAWMGGDKSDAGIVFLANEFARRGYVVVSVNYRLGLHKANWALTPFQKAVNAGFHASYISDSLEVYRGYFRAIQDIKGAIRFMKARNTQDSTCINSVFVGGESAGGFNALGVAFLDISTEKPAACYAVPDVPMPQTNLLDNYPGGKVNSVQLKRPDLGKVEGDLNLNGYDSKVRGALNLFGGLPAEAISNNWVSGKDSIIVYMTHQTCDGIVPCGEGIALSPLSIHCNLGFTPFHTKWPLISGTCHLKSVFASGKMKLKMVKSEIFNCADITFPLNDCIRFANNGSYHYTINAGARVDSIAHFISQVVKTDMKNCAVLSIDKPSIKNKIYLFPNPNYGIINIEGFETNLINKINVYDVLGKSISFERTGPNSLRLEDSKHSQLYYIEIHKGDEIYRLKSFVLTH